MSKVLAQTELTQERLYRIWQRMVRSIGIEALTPAQR